jgi:hypothetical protein
MIASILRAVGVALLTAGLCEGVAYVDFLKLCDAHHAWERRQTDATAVVLDGGFGVARPGDALFVCTRPHCWAFDCHEDTVCVCAPASDGAHLLETLLSGSCTIDRLTPSIADETGACRHARCDSHVGP